ncbi:hypothetical protein JCM6882_008839 [Rhodosporidiobolus microsporus]
MTAATPDLPARVKLKATISRVEDGDDLVGWAEGQLLAFGERIYADVEPLPSRARFDTRVSRFARRVRPLVDRPDILIHKATIPVLSERTGKPVVGALAFWHLPGAAVDNVQKNTEEQAVADPEAFEGYDWKKWNEMLEKYDVVRRRVMGNTPHWYLGPLWTHPDYQGQGLAGQLLRHAISLADAADPPEAMYLEASPAGMPVYARYGWERIEGTETAMLRKPKAQGGGETV